MSEINNLGRITVFEICVTIEGKVTYLDNQLNLLLQSVGIESNIFEYLFNSQPVSKIVKNRKSNVVACPFLISGTGLVEILKSIEINPHEWQVVFVKADTIQNIVPDKISTDELFNLLDLIPHPIFIKNSKREYLHVNKAFSVLFEVSKKKIVGLKDEDFLHDQKEVTLLESADLMVINDGEDVELPEYTHIRLNGDRQNLFTLRLAHGNNTETRKVLGVTIDITSRRKNKKELEKTNFELENFVYRTSHDLIGPIKTLKGLIYVGRLDPNNFLKSITLDNFDNILTSLDIYIRELVDFAYNRSAIVNVEKLNLKDMLFASYVNANKWIKHTETLLRLDVDKNLLIYSDSGRLQSVLHIVYSNALHFSKPGKQYIDTKAYHNEKKLVIEIQDYGIGIKEQVIPKVFDMYYRGNQGSTGSGLGLYNAKETLKKLKGDIKIESEEGIGTKVIITIPFQKVD